MLVQVLSTTPSSRRTLLSIGAVAFPGLSTSATYRPQFPSPNLPRRCTTRRQPAKQHLHHRVQCVPLLSPPAWLTLFKSREIGIMKDAQEGKSTSGQGTLRGEVGLTTELGGAIGLSIPTLIHRVHKSTFRYPEDKNTLLLAHAPPPHSHLHAALLWTQIPL
jgi:hypothetical protein